MECRPRLLECAGKEEKDVAPDFLNVQVRRIRRRRMRRTCQAPRYLSRLSDDASIDDVDARQQQ